MIGQPYNPDQCAFLLNQALNANLFNPNVPDASNNTNHIVLWNFIESKLLWVNTITNLIESEIGDGGIPTLQQVLDFNHDLVNGNNFQGTKAGVDNTGTGVLAHGSDAALSNTGNEINAIGYAAARENTGSNVNAIGGNAAYLNSGFNVNAFGNESASQNTGNLVNAIGGGAARENTGDNVVAIGTNAALGNTLSGQFIINNANIPSYPNAGAATAGLAGGVAGNTYLYWDSGLSVLNAVRL